MCHYEFISSRSNYNKGAMTMEEVFEALKTVYKSEQAAGTWSDLMTTKHEITMLTTTPIAIIAKNNLLLYQSCLCYFREHSTVSGAYLNSNSNKKKRKQGTMFPPILNVQSKIGA